jgi:polyisoprenoid-binding protein YceI
MFELRTLNSMRLAVLGLLISAAMPSVSQEVPVFAITPDGSSVKFHVKASVALDGTFDKWDASMTFTSPDITTGVLDIKIQADSVNSGSGMKDGKLKSKEFFNVKDDPFITFHSTKVVQTGPTTVEMPGTFTIRGVSKPETLTFTITGAGTGAGAIKGTMVFDRKEFGMTHGIPFVTIADSIDVTVELKGKRISGPALVLAQK